MEAWGREIQSRPGRQFLDDDLDLALDDHFCFSKEGDSHPDEAVGIQRDQDLFPTLKTLIVKYLYSTRW